MREQILGRDWTSDTTITAVLDTIFGLMYQPEYDDPVNTTLTLEYHHDQVEFAEQVREYVRKHASRSREDWRARVLGEVEESGDEAEEEDEYDEDSEEEDEYDDGAGDDDYGV